jgi:hypothetical protein
MGAAARKLTRWCRSQHSHAFVLAVFTAFRFVFKLLIAEKELFAGGEYKVRAAIDALENLVLVFHLKVRSQRDLLGTEDPDSKDPVPLVGRRFRHSPSCTTPGLGPPRGVRHAATTFLDWNYNWEVKTLEARWLGAASSIKI